MFRLRRCLCSRRTGRVDGCSIAAVARADVVLDWNIIALKTTAAAPFNPPLETRNLAIVHAAMFDAVNAIDARVSSVCRQASRIRLGIARSSGHRGCTRGARAVVSGAAVDVGCGVHTSLDRIPDGPGKTSGRRVGEAVARGY